MVDARSGSGDTLGSLGIITIGGAIGLVAVFFVVQCYRGWQRWSKARQGAGQSAGHHCDTKLRPYTFSSGITYAYCTVPYVMGENNVRYGKMQLHFVESESLSHSVLTFVNFGCK